MRYLGVDVGDKRIGIALGESFIPQSFPLKTIQNTGEQAFQEILALAQSEAVDGIVVGVPLSTGGHHSAGQLEKTREWIRFLTTMTKLPVYEEDEAYSSTESKRIKKEEGYNADIDSLAAMVIVQAYMNRTKNT